MLVTRLVTAILLSFILTIPDIDGHVVSGVRKISKTFTVNRLFRSPTIKYALQDVTVEFSGITAFCGSTGSGKSTLARLIHGQYPRAEYEGEVLLEYMGGIEGVGGEWGMGGEGGVGGIGGERGELPAVYLDPLYYLSYDTTKTVRYHLNPLNPDKPTGNSTGNKSTKATIETEGPEGTKATKVTGTQTAEGIDEQSVLLRTLLEVFNIPLDSTVGNLLESQRKFFEIMLLFSKMKRKEKTVKTVKTVTTGSTDSEENRDFEELTDSRGLLILDEYLDKDMSSVRNLFFKKMRELRMREDIDFQVIIVSHSKSVCHSCDTVIALKNGFVYSNGKPDKIMKYLPPEFVILE